MTIKDFWTRRRRHLELEMCGQEEQQEQEHEEVGKQRNLAGHAAGVRESQWLDAGGVVVVVDRAGRPRVSPAPVKP